MRGRMFFAVLLGLSMAALPAFAYRFPREKPAHETPGKPDRPGMDRSRPGDEGAQTVSRAQGMSAPGSRNQMTHQGTTGKRPALGNPGQANSTGGGSSRMACNEADECHMSSTGTKAAVAAAASTRAPGNGSWGKINNAKGQSMLGKANASARTSFNEAGESNGMSKKDAQKAIFQAAHTRAPNSNHNVDKINNAKGKSLLGRASPSSRMACNEAEECSMGNSGAKAEWQKANSRSRHP
jgi:hypothetical protein